MKTGILAGFALAICTFVVRADTLAITNVTRSGQQTGVQFPLLPATKSYTFLSTTNLSQPFATNYSFSLTPFGQPEYVIDNVSATVVGTWSTGTTASTDKFGTDYRFKSQGGGTSYLQYTPNLQSAGTYDVFEWHPQGSNRTTNAPYVITHASGTTTVLVNEMTGGGGWNLLGRFSFPAGTGGNVKITDGFPEASQVVLADAVKFTGVGFPPGYSNVGSVQGYEWRVTETAPQSFHRVVSVPLDTNAVLAATVLNRLAYGPTPDDLELLLSTPTGAQDYINQQLSPELITEEVNNSHTNIDFIEGKFANPDQPVFSTNAGITDLRAWHTLRAVGAKRQLLEVLLQFLENHFVTQYSKSVDYFDQYYDDGTLQGRFATQFEYWENQKWRAALLNPTCTFYDLLKISAESPAMIIYLDTVSSRGDGGRVANENYARELFELFCFGVDNGYDQTDIVECSKCWTGWRVQIVDATNAFNPFVGRTTNNLPGVTNNFSSVSNLLGCWAFNYQSTYHNNNSKILFSNKFVPARFGAPYTTYVYPSNTVAGKYQFTVPARSGTNAIQDGYDVIRFLADLPFTQEYISVKLCRLFVHDDFPNPSNDPSNPAYAFYNYAGGNLSPEADLVRQCMLAWQNGSPKGQIRDVLEVIFNSDLFRSQQGAAQKVKTPLEYVVSAVRALRVSTNGIGPGTFTADTDGYAFNTPLNRMGGMLLFDRDAPDGYSEFGPPWISAGTLAERVRFIQSFCIASGQTGHTGGQSGTGNDAQNCTSAPVELLKRKLSAQNLTNATAVADYFLGILYPGEGGGNLEAYRQSAIQFLNTSDTGASSPFSALSVSSTAGQPYDTRVRGMLGLLMSMQRFQEQ